MMGSKVSRKDVDFMILLSTYLLNEDYSTIKEKMTNLAELGQVNAIQYFYANKSEFEVNQKIDDNLKKLMQTESYENDFALRNYLLAKEKTDKYFLGKYKGLQEFEASSVLDIEKGCFKKLKQYLAETSSPVVFVRYLELKKELGKNLTQVDKQNLKKMQNKLLSFYKEKPRNVLVAFAIGRCLISFSEDKELNLLGKQILSETSKRKLSKQLEEYQDTNTQFLKIDKPKNKATAKTQKVKGKELSENSNNKDK